MPELPEVETVRRQLKEKLNNRIIKKVIIYYNDIIAYPKIEEFKKQISNQKINDIKRRGKWLIFELDSYYLLQERLYRSLYNKVKDLEENSIDFSLKTSYDKFPFKENRYSRCLFSKTELWFYLPLFLVCLAVIIFVNIDNIQICIKNIINS